MLKTVQMSDLISNNSSAIIAPAPQKRNKKALIGCIVAGAILAFLPNLLNIVGPSRRSPATVYWWDFMDLPGKLVADAGGIVVPNIVLVKTADWCFYSVLVSQVFWFSWWWDRRKWKALATCIVAGTVLAFLPDIFDIAGAPHGSFAFLLWKLPGEIIADNIIAHNSNGTPYMIVVNTVDLCFYTALASPIVRFFWIEKRSAKSHDTPRSR